MPTLTGSGWEARLLPACGGSIAALRHDGADVLRPAPADATDPLAMASFPLVPYANRIAQGRFAFDGQSFALPRNFGDHPHSLHGIGWQSAWSVADVRPDAATLRLAHAADENWPWAFTAEQHVAVGAHGFEHRLTLRNDDRTPMPAGLGFHPYFPAAPDTRLTARLQAAWLADETQLPTDPVAPDRFGDWAAGDGIVKDRLVDHCHAGWDGVATIDAGWDGVATIDAGWSGVAASASRDRTLRLTADGTRFLHLYLPPGERFFCVEPVSHLPDAINRPGQGMATLAPGESIAIAMRLEIG